MLSNVASAMPGTSVAAAGIGARLTGAAELAQPIITHSALVATNFAFKPSGLTDRIR